jgi:hypothetical protein
VSDYPVSPQDPAELIAWLRELTVGTVLLDSSNDAWQLGELEGEDDSFLAWQCTSDDHNFRLDSETDMDALVPWRPLRVLHLPQTGGE